MMGIRNTTKLAAFWIITAFLFGTLFSGGISTAQGIGQGYITQDADLKTGMMVVISGGGTPNKPQVERAGPDNTDKIIGVTTNVEDNAVIIASGEQQVYVQNSGEATAYVSDVNGAVKKGDSLTGSPLKGILMRADPNSYVAAKSLEDYSGSTETLTIQSGTGTKTVALAKLKVTLDIPPVRGQSNENNTALKKFGKVLAGKDVGEVQLIVALLIFLIVMIVEGAIIYGAISSAITSMGRNPLGKRNVISGLVRVAGIALIVLIIGLAAVYIILRL